MKCVLFAIPAYGKQSFKPSDAALLATRSILAQNKIFSDEISVSDSHIDRARNTLSFLCLSDFKLPKAELAKMISTSPEDWETRIIPNLHWDTMVMVDGDIVPDPGRLAHNISLSLTFPDSMGFVAHPCPIKCLPPLPNFKGTLKPFEPSEHKDFKDGSFDISVGLDMSEYCTVEQIGAGCVIISRNCLEKVREQVEEDSDDYASDSPDPTRFGKRMWNMWSSGVWQTHAHSDEEDWTNRKWDSEDYGFCTRLARLGIAAKVDMHPAARCKHIGLYDYEFES